MKKEVIEKVSAEFKAAVRAAVAAGAHKVWGNAESASVVEKLVELAIGDEEVAEEGYDAIRGKVLEVINPSAFAQKLEALPDGTGKDKDGEADVTADGTATPMHPAYLRRPQRGAGRGKKLDV